ncbi:MAG: LacI family transcriptional regulator [Oscillospiraceae bacterium]|nr:LacI family transcriptional regulator [Oscillospiraceae bacterium]
MSNLTIRDIARMAGVSTTAVSFVLNGRGGVSEATRQRIQDIIQRTGFTPNVHTRRLNLGKSFTLHVVLHWYEYDLFNQFALEILYGVFKASKALGYSVIFTFVDNSMDSDQLMESVRSKDCDGVILSQIEDPSFIAQLQREKIPFICADSHIPHDGALPLVEVDYFQAAYDATMHLCRRGHTEIGFIGPQTPQEFHQSTFGGYAAALRDEELVCNPAWMPSIPFAETSAADSIEQLLQCPWLPTAFLCAGDPFAIDAIRCAKARGLRIPHDISVISLDDLLVSRYTDPPLTTMSFDKELLGRRAVEVLCQLINGEDCQAVNLLPAVLVERGTVRDLRK